MHKPSLGLLGMMNPCTHLARASHLFIITVRIKMRKFVYFYSKNKYIE